jgi:hypothetical protein
MSSVRWRSAPAAPETNIQPDQNTTGVASRSISQPATAWGTSSRPRSPLPIGESRTVGMVSARATQKRVRMSRSMAAAMAGSDMSWAMPDSPWPIAAWSIPAPAAPCPIVTRSAAADSASSGWGSSAWPIGARSTPSPVAGTYAGATCSGSLAGRAAVGVRCRSMAECFLVPPKRVRWWEIGNLGIPLPTRPPAGVIPPSPRSLAGMPGARRRTPRPGVPDLLLRLLRHLRHGGGHGGELAEEQFRHPGAGLGGSRRVPALGRFAAWTRTASRGSRRRYFWTG